MPLFQWRPFCVALAVVAALTTIVWLVNPPVYLTNDDVSIRLGLEGHAVPGQPPTGFVLFTTSLLAWTVVAAHRFLPTIPWWDCVVSGTLVWALAVVFSVAWSSLGCGWLGRATAVGAVLIAVVPLVGGLQFTIAATLAGGAAALIVALEVGTAPSVRRPVLAMSAALLASGALVRPIGAAAGALAVGLCLIPLAVARGFPLRRVTTALVAVIALCAAVRYLDALPYKLDQGWDDYRRYNWMVVRLLQWGGGVSTSEADAIRGAVGWSSNDWMMLRWFAVDPLVHGISHLAKAHDTRSALVGWDSMIARSWFDPVRIGGSLRDVLAQSIFPLLGIAAVAIARGKRRGIAVAGMIAGAFCALCIGLEIAYEDLPFRVLAPLQTCVVTVAVVAVGLLTPSPTPPRSMLGLATIVAMLTVQIPAALRASTANHSHSQQVDREVQDLVRLSPSLIVLHADSFPREHWWRPFRRPPIDLPAIALGSNNHNPLLQKFLSNTLRQPLLEAMCTDPSILVVADEGRLHFATTYLREHVNISVEWTQVMEGSFSFPVWRCSAVDAAVSQAVPASVRSWPARWPTMTRRRATDAPTS